MKIRILKAGWGYDVDSIIEVAENDGIPLENFWRRRLRDASIDGCCEIVKEVSSTNTYDEDES